MTLNGLPLRMVAMSFALGLASIASASPAGQNAGAAAGSPDSGKIPVTTASDAAKKEFLQGRELAEKLQAQDSIQHFDKAISLDPNFALAELSRANAGATRQRLFRPSAESRRALRKGVRRRTIAHPRHRGRCQR